MMILRSLITINTTVKTVKTFIVKPVNQKGNHQKHHLGLGVVHKVGVPVKTMKNRIYRRLDRQEVVHTVNALQ